MKTPSFSLTILEKKIAFSTLVQYAGKAVQILLAVITVKLVSNFFVKSEGSYGIYAAINEYALFFSVVANLGIFANVVRKMADNPLDGKIFINALFLRVVTSGMIFGAAMIVLIFMGVSQIFILGAALFLGALFFEYITSVCDGMLQANYMMGKATIALIIGRIINAVGVFFAGKLCLYLFTSDQISTPYPLATALFFTATLLGSFITAIISFYFVHKEIKLDWKIDKTFFISMLKMGLPFGIITIINSLYFRFLPDYFSHHFLNDAQFGAFNISFRIAQVVSLLSTFLMFSALPGLKQYIDLAEWGKASKLYKKLEWFLLVTGVMLVIFGSLLGPKIIELLTHKIYFLPEFWFVLPMMLILAAISYGYDLVLITLFALEKDRWFLKKELLALFLALIFFNVSLLHIPFQLKLIVIISGAIIGESTMVILGTIKIKEFFKQLPEV